MEERKATILIVEDNLASRELLVEYLGTESDYVVLEAEDAHTGFELMRANRVDLVLLDVMLPDESGFSLCRRMKSASPVFVPIVMVTALNAVADKVNGLEAGADDFIAKPVLKEELIARTRSHLRTKRMMDRIEQYRRELSMFNERLHQQVDLRTRQLKDALAQLRRAKDEVEKTRLEILERLGAAAEYRDQDIGGHVRRVSAYVYEIAVAFGVEAETAETFRLAAPMHDIGKMGVSDHVLFKPSRLEEGEVELIKEHTVIGARILAHPRTELMEIARQMAEHHHERWDGKGYPEGVSGDQIPLPARICAVADVFDAMTSGRVYRPVPLSVEEARSEVVASSGSRFDPSVVRAFLKAFDKLLEAKAQIDGPEWTPEATQQGM